MMGIFVRSKEESEVNKANLTGIGIGTRNYGNYLGSKGFGGASDERSRAEGCG